MTKAPYFHHEGGSTELRIPLASKQKHNLQALLDFFPNEAHALAGCFAKSPLELLENRAESSSSEGVISLYCRHTGKNPQETFDALAHFHKQGWVWIHTLDEAKKSLAQWTASKLLEPGSREKLEKKILRTLQESRFPELDSARALLMKLA